MMVFVLALLMLAPPQTTTDKGTIEGTVTRFGTGEPIPDVEIVFSFIERSTTEPQAITDSKGHFVINDVPRGTYSIRAQRMGYAAPAPNGIRMREGGETRTVTISPGEITKDANLTMVTAGAITGRILDSNGKPEGNSFVMAESTDTGGRGVAYTNDQGDYHIVGLSPGKYYIFSDNGYYPGVLEKAKATPLEITEGAVVAGIDMMLRNREIPADVGKVFFVSGKVLDSDGGPLPPLTFPIVALLRHNPDGASNKTEDHFSGGSGSAGFYIQNVPPGRYDLYLYFNYSRLNGARTGLIGRMDINVSDQDVKDVVLTPGGVSVSGQLMTAGTTTAPSGSVRLNMASNAIYSREIKSEAGAFTIPNVVSGVWRVEVTNLPPDLALFDVRQREISVFERGFPVENEAPEKVQVILGPGGSLEGTVRDEERGPIGAAQVLVIPDKPDPLRPAMQIRKAITDGAGRFSLSNIATGSYKIFALDPSVFSADSIPDGNEELRRFLTASMESKATTTTIGAGSKLNLSLPLN